MGDIVGKAYREMWKKSQAKMLAEFNAGNLTQEEYLANLKQLADITKQDGAYNEEFERVKAIEKQDTATDKSEDFMEELITYTKEQDQKREGFALEERDYQRGLAEKADLEKQNIVDEMLEESNISDKQYEDEIGKSTSDVKQAFASSEDSAVRSARRYGLNPNSGRFKSMQRGNEIAEAATTAGAQNQTRSRLKAFGENKKDNARRVELGLNPIALNVQDKRIGMVGETGGALNSGAGFYGNQSARLQGQQNFNRQMDFNLMQFNARPTQPSFSEQLLANGIGGAARATAGYALKKYAPF